MKAKSKKITKKKVANFEPGIVTFLIAVVSVLSLVFLAYLGVLFSK